jgi:hypothetical protein
MLAAPSSCPVDEDPGEKLLWVGQGIVVEPVSVLGLVDEKAGAAVESESRKIDGSAHEVTGQLMQALGVCGIDGGSIVDAETLMPP